MDATSFTYLLFPRNSKVWNKHGLFLLESLLYLLFRLMEMALYDCFFCRSVCILDNFSKKLTHLNKIWYKGPPGQQLE